MANLRDCRAVQKRTVLNFIQISPTRNQEAFFFFSQHWFTPEDLKSGEILWNIHLSQQAVNVIKKPPDIPHWETQ